MARRMATIDVLERAISAVSPRWAESRSRSRMHVMSWNQAYEAAEPGRLRKRTQDFGSGNAAAGGSAEAIRSQARHLDRNHDIVVNGLNTLTQNVIGPTGIGIEPQPHDANGDVNESVVEQLQDLQQDFSRTPEVTRTHDYASMQRLSARTLFRDGEVFRQDLVGPVRYLDHGHRVPYSVEMIEPDLVPFGINDPSRNIVNGVECNAWGRAIAYHMYKQHPGDPNAYLPPTKRVSADMIHHAKLIDRIGQRRGVSLLASVLTRLEDLKDYEESERIAAKIAACMAAAIIKGSPTEYDAASNLDADGKALPQRRMRFEPGMVFDNLREGESVSTIDTSRPNSNLENHRNGQLRAVSGGMRVSFSSLSKNYGTGSYSAMRQELVEQYGAYGVLAYQFIAMDVRPMWERFVNTAVLSGELVLPSNMALSSVSDALYLPPTMPWIDPLKEAKAMEILEDNAYMSGQEIIRRRGANPRDVLDQESAWRARKRKWNIPDASHNASKSRAQSPANAQDTNQ